MRNAAVATCATAYRVLGDGSFRAVREGEGGLPAFIYMYVSCSLVGMSAQGSTGPITPLSSPLPSLLFPIPPLSLSLFLCSLAR